MDRKGKSLNYLFFVVCLYILVFQNFLQTIIKPFQYFDEILALMLIPIVFFKIFLKRDNKLVIKKNYLIGFVLLMIIFITGIYSNFKFKYQPSSVYLSDALLVFKFFFVYLVGILLWKDTLIKKYEDNINNHVKFIIYLLFILTILNYIFIIWPYEYRFGIMTNKLFFSHPTMLAGICIFLLSLLILTSKKINKFDIFVLIFMLITTLRFKAIGAVVVIFMIIIYVQKSQKKISVTKLGILSILILILVWDQVNYYYFKIDDSARNQLTINSFKIAKDYFPFGTGFGTFGSYMSGVNYSPVYYKYNISNIYGITKGHTEFISDTFWPMIIGQFGVIGTICYIVCLIMIFKKIQREFTTESINIYLSKVICFVYLLIASTSESAFVHPMAIPLAIVLAL